MNLTQFYLTKLAEEASEVAQIALKTQQFGMNEKRRDQPYLNYERIHQELDDLLTIVDLLNTHCGLGYRSSQEAINRKKERVAEYLQYSVDLGQVNLND